MFARRFGPRLNPRLVRNVNTQTPERFQLLRKIYAPFEDLKKGSPEYLELAKSGKVWENYFQPGDSMRYGYVDLQKACLPLHNDAIMHTKLTVAQKFSATLSEIDGLKELMKPRSSYVSRGLIADYAHQSVQIEQNVLRIRDSRLIDDHLNEKLFRGLDLASMSAGDVYRGAFPDVYFLFPNAENSQVAELRNHIVASHWVTEKALRNPGTAGVSEQEIRDLSAIINKGTNAEERYRMWGTSVQLGDYRSTPIQVASYPLRVFPYHVEVPALMKRFFQWLETVHRKKELHPLVVACQATSFFLHIHPFPDGNGRCSRLLMQDYMIRQGYFPVVFQALDRRDYIRMISDAQDGKAEEFVSRVLSTQLDEMRTFWFRENQ